MGWARQQPGAGWGGAVDAGEPAEAARPGEKGQSFLARSAVLELGAACGTHASGVSALPRLSEGRGPLSRRVGAASRGPGLPLTLSLGFPPAPPLKLARRRLGVWGGTFQTQGFQSHTEKGSEEVFALNSNKGQHARRFGRNSIIVINN